MLKDLMVEHGAPTLAGIKTGNIFSIQTKKNEIASEIRKLNGILTKKGLRLIPIKRSSDKTMMYLYRPDRLERDLSSPEAEEILEEKGYPCGNMNCCIVELVRHLMMDEEFPHEIGLFLGYPPSDVKGFMKSSCEGVKCVGCWKAYGNENEAKSTFEKYDTCRSIYRKEANKGRPLESLIVDMRLDAKLAI
ncbi:MAG: DUF3793 family protein [Lachnospiraceae bacterium]|nr:DUF3793 family protein [Lachnospiraceae bacterium]